MAQWYYSTVSVRLVSKDNTYALSGIHLIFKDSSKRISFDFILTINYIPNVEDYRILINSGNEVDNDAIQDDTVSWYPGKVVNNIPLTTSGNKLSQYLAYFRKNGFNLIPYDIVNKKSDSDNFDNLALLKLDLHPSCKQQFLQKYQKKYQRITFHDNQVNNDLKNVPIIIKSYPFNFTNSLIFSNFLSNGTINYVFKDNIGYLSDIKYLENMIGGVVLTDNTHTSIGLVLGNIKKLNGDGDLTCILSWNTIWNLLIEFDSKLNKYSTSILRLNRLSTVLHTTASKSATTLPTTSVFPITIRNAITSSWGSCVYYDKSCFITNFHVLQPFIGKHDVRCEIHISPSCILNITNDDNIITPFGSIDLSFIKLSHKNANLLNSAHSSISPVKKCKQYGVGDRVISQGFGLFYNLTNISPLESQGIINCKVQLPITPTSLKSNSMIITSSSCWNGSSGGGLFKRVSSLPATLEFVGLICSNAQIKIPNLLNESYNPESRISSANEPNDDIVEKLSKFSLILPIEIIDYCYAHKVLNSNPSISPTINGKIKDIWQLKSFHNDVVIGPTKV